MNNSNEKKSNKYIACPCGRQTYRTERCPVNGIIYCIYCIEGNKKEDILEEKFYDGGDGIRKSPKP